MSNLATMPTAPAPAVTAEQLDLIRRTVANGATPDNLQLYLYDCARQGVHPLDKLIHFTQRKGKYTPVTSIDFMRIRAADTGEYAGSDDAVHAGTPAHADFAATVTVWRIVQGQRVSFTATARWSEYKPDSDDFMWRKMPHTMLDKCAEGLALRKGFPKQLAGLYAKEEMDQAGPSTTSDAPPTPTQAPLPVAPVKPDTFEEWWGRAEFVADNDGIAALTAHWKATTTAVRAYVNEVMRAQWDALKKDAEKVTAAKATAAARDSESSPFDDEEGR